MKYLLALIIAVALTGCATSPEKDVLKDIRYECEQPIIIQMIVPEG